MIRHHSAGYLLEGSKLQHVAIAERALGRLLPDGAEVHHVNEIRDDNRNENLVICPDRVYHALLHMRARALDACGDPAKRKCVYCKAWDDVSNMSIRDKGPKGIEHRHRACHSANQRERIKRARAKS